MKIIAFFVCLLFVLANNAEADRPIFTVNQNGDLLINDKKIIQKAGIDPPDIFTEYGSKFGYDGRKYWYSVEKLGAIVHKYDDDNSDGFTLILPLKRTRDFPTILFNGSFKTPSGKIDLEASKLTEKEVLYNLGINIDCVKREGADLSVDYGRTSLVLGFDNGGFLEYISVTVDPTLKK